MLKQFFKNRNFRKNKLKVTIYNQVTAFLDREKAKLNPILPHLEQNCGWYLSNGKVHVKLN